MCIGFFLELYNKYYFVAAGFAAEVAAVSTGVAVVSTVAGAGVSIVAVVSGATAASSLGLLLQEAKEIATIAVANKTNFFIFSIV
ncbi:MAG: hypothetical protein ACK5MK_15770 [Dysgonomonas sp.]